MIHIQKAKGVAAKNVSLDSVWIKVRTHVSNRFAIILFQKLLPIKVGKGCPTLIPDSLNSVDFSCDTVEYINTQDISEVILQLDVSILDPFVCTTPCVITLSHDCVETEQGVVEHLFM